MSQVARGESFYFFDLDDNVLYLDTRLLLRSKSTGAEKALTTAEFAKARSVIGTPGAWEDFEFFDATYRHYYDLTPAEAAAGKQQYLVADIEKAIEKPPAQWQGPAWPFLVHACREQRPIAFITARAQSRSTIQAGIRVLVERGLLASEPNYLQIYAVNNPEMAEELLNSVADAAERAELRETEDRTSAMKRIAIRNTVDRAIEQHGAAAPHRFGMSDDDPMNIDLIIKALSDCKSKYMQQRFFAISTHRGEHVKLEVFPMEYPVTGHSGAGDPIG